MIEFFLEVIVKVMILFVIGLFGIFDNMCCLLMLFVRLKLVIGESIMS